MAASSLLSSTPPRTLFVALVVTVSLTLALIARSGSASAPAPSMASHGIAAVAPQMHRGSAKMMASPAMAFNDGAAGAAMESGAGESTSLATAAAPIGDTVGRMRAAAPPPAPGGRAPLEGPVVLRSGSMSAEVMAIAAAAARVASIATELKGFVEISNSRSEEWMSGRWRSHHSQLVEALKEKESASASAADKAALIAAIAVAESAKDGSTHADLQLRVPAADFDAARARVHALAAELGGRVTREDSSGVDVTEHYVDVVARQAVDAKSLAQLDVLLSSAASVQEVLTVKHEMDSVSARLEGLAAQRKSLEGRAAMSSLGVAFVLPAPPNAPPPAPRPQPGWSAGAVFAQAVGSLGSAAQELASILIFALVFAVPVGLAAGGVFVLVSRFKLLGGTGAGAGAR